MKVQGKPSGKLQSIRVRGKVVPDDKYTFRFPMVETMATTSEIS